MSTKTCYENDGKTKRACSAKEKELNSVISKLQKDIPSMIDKLQKDIKTLKKLKEAIATEKGIRNLLSKDANEIISTLNSITSKILDTSSTSTKKENNKGKLLDYTPPTETTYITPSKQDINFVKKVDEQYKNNVDNDEFFSLYTPPSEQDIKKIDNKERKKLYNELGSWNILDE